MNRLAFALPALAASAALVAGCSSSGPSATGSTGGSTAGSTGASTESGGSTGAAPSTTGGGSGDVASFAAKPCGVFTAAALNAALKTSVGAGSTSAEVDGRCDYKPAASGGEAVYVSFTKTAEADFSSELGNPAYKGSYAATPTRIGDDSVFQTLTPDSLAVEVITGGYKCTIGMNFVPKPSDATLRAGLVSLAKSTF